MDFRSSISLDRVEEEDIRTILKIFPFSQVDFQEGVKYLCFLLKPNDYRKNDWNWLIEKLDIISKILWNICVSLKGILTLAKSIPKEILVY